MSDRRRTNAAEALRTADATSASTYGSIASREGSRERRSTRSPVENTDQNSRNDVSQERRRHTLKNYGPRLLLENSGSVARDHLASERTFLAYVRTSLALASAGVGEHL